MNGSREQNDPIGPRDRIELQFGRWGMHVHRHPWWVIGAMVALTLVLASGLGQLRLEMSTDRYLDARDPARITYDEFRRQFANDDNIVVLVHSEDAFSFGSLERLRDLHRDIEDEVPLLDEAQGLINARDTRGIGDELIVEELFEHWPENDAERERLAERARSNPIYLNSLISRDGRYTSITLSFTPGGELSDADALEGFAEEASGIHDSSPPEADGLPPVLMDDDLMAVMDALVDISERHRSDDFQIWLSGNPEITYALTIDSRREMPRLTGLALLVIAVFLGLLFRRISGTALPLLIVFVPLLTTLGSMGHLGVALTPSTRNLPSFLLAVCVGDAVHILSIFYRRYDGGSTKEEALSHALAHSGLAVVMTSLTTAGAMASFAFADLTPLASLGIAAPIGVLLALVYALVLLPALIVVLPIRRRAVESARQEAKPAGLDRALAGIGGFSTRRPWLVIVIWCVLAAASIHGAAQLEVAHRPFEWFPEDHSTRVAAETFNREMNGLMPLEIIIDTGRENGLHDPELLRRIDRLAQVTRELDVNGIRVGHALSFVDILKETHRALNENDPAFYALPGDRALAAQELLLFENSGSDDLEELVDSQFSKARLSLLVTYHDGFLYLDLLNAIQDAADEIIEDHATVHTTGLVELWLRTFFAMLTSTFKSYAIALIVIAPLMILLIGDVRLGLLSLIPNLFPIVMGMAMMSVLGIHFDMMTMMVGTIAIGVAVDDTIHFMNGFRRSYERGGDAALAVQQTLLSTGRALVITSLVLSAGFFVQTTGGLIGARNAGLITGLMVLAALAADVVLSPAIVTLAARYRKGSA